MKLRRLLCFAVRHRWVPSPDDSDESVLILECARCGREQVFSDTFEMEGWLERWGRQEIAQSPYVNPRHSDPRFHERRP